jgi:hypothetical protein
MANRRLSMRKIKEVLRFHQEIGLSERQIAKSCGISRSTVKDYLHRAQRAELTWPLPSNLDDAQLENLLFPPIRPIPPENRGMPPLDYLYQELKKKGITLQLLWCEYKQSNPEGYQYSQFCKRYQSWVDKLDVCLRQEYRAGEKLFVDYAGQTIPVQKPISLWLLWVPAITPSPKPVSHRIYLPGSVPMSTPLSSLVGSLKSSSPIIRKPPSPILLDMNRI